KRQAAAPDQPWAWKHEPGTNVISGTSPVASIALFGIFAAIWLAITALATVAAWDQMRSEVALRVVLGLFWAAGLFVAGMALYSVARARRFGRCTVTLDAVPARLGGWLSGVVHAPLAVQGADVQVSVECERTTHSRGSSDSSTSKWVVWRQTHLLDGQRFARGASGVEVPFAVRLPTSAEVARENNRNVVAEIFRVDEIDLAGEDIDWYVSASASLPGVDWDDRFHVPVAPAEPGAAVPASPPREMAPLSGARLTQHLPGRLEHRLDADVFVFPLKPSWFVWTLMFMGLAAAGLLGPSIPALAQLPEKLLFWTAVVCGVLSALSVIGLMLDTRSIEVRPGEVRIRRGLGGIGFHRTIPRAEIAGVEEETSKSNPPSYSVNIRTRAGKSYWAMTPVNEQERAAALAARLRQVLQLSPAPE
ncbi:MAG TPA: hypothetical protein VFO85_11560, partial [Vicinamibacteria bacterium]|nr:hypothetical protein [Vicinamibacteria bacterium]